MRHPGQVLREDFMAPLKLSAGELADLAGVRKQRLVELIDGQRAITPDVALRLGRVFRMKPRHWLAMQNAWDLAQLEVPDDVRQADLRGFVTGPHGAIPLPERPKPPPVDPFPPEMAEAVEKAATLLAPFKVVR